MKNENAKWLELTIGAVAIGMVLYHLTYTQYMILGPIHHQNLHYMLALVLVFLWSMKSARARASQVVSIALAVASIYATGYMFVNFSELQEMRGPLLDLTLHDKIVGILLIGLGLEATRRAFGWIFPLVALCFIAYAVFGSNLPGPIATPHIPITELLTSYAMGLMDGIYGQVLGISANYIFLFVLFGGVLSVTGASRFFNQVGAITGKHLSGGPAITAVVSSALMGSVTGSAMANVATTGAFTIPMMKKVGYQPHQAGAIEAAASTGGQIMPPVMGATAFVLAEMVEVSYVKVMAAALVPALLYFLSVGIYAQLQAKRMNIKASMDNVRFSLYDLLKNGPIFLLPLLAIIVILILGYSPMFTIFWAICILLALNFLDIAFRKDHDALRNLVPAFISGAEAGAKIAVTCAVLGPIITTVTKTVLGLKIPSVISLWCQGSLPLALLITMCACIILGMGVPTLAAYLLVSLVGTPVLVELGVQPFAAHMFVFIFACFSCLTPPIAISAIPAAGIAGSSYMRTAMEASKVGVLGFIVPYLLVYAPELMIGQSGNGTFAASFTIAVFSIFMLGPALSAYARQSLNAMERSFFGLSAILLFAYLISKKWETLVAGLIVGIGIMAFQRKRPHTVVVDN